MPSSNHRHDRMTAPGSRDLVKRQLAQSRQRSAGTRQDGGTPWGQGPSRPGSCSLARCSVITTVVVTSSSSSGSAVLSSRMTVTAYSRCSSSHCAAQSNDAASSSEYVQLSVQLVMLDELNTLSNTRLAWIRHLSFCYLGSFCAVRSMNSGRVNPSRHQPSVRHCSGDGCGSVRLVIAKPDLRSSSV
jgi:hypothetical protein